MRPLVLVINAGSSSIKFELFDGITFSSLFSGLIEAIGTEYAALNYLQNEQKSQKKLGCVDFYQALAQTFSTYKQLVPPDGQLQAVGHRVVHGGALFSEPS